jgi:hypothetical protein
VGWDYWEWGSALVVTLGEDFEKESDEGLNWYRP